MSFFTNKSEIDATAFLETPGTLSPKRPDVNFMGTVNAAHDLHSSGELAVSPVFNRRKAVSERNKIIREQMGVEWDEVRKQYGFDSIQALGNIDRERQLDDEALERFKETIQDATIRNQIHTGKALEDRALEIGQRDFQDAEDRLQRSSSSGVAFAAASLLGGFGAMSKDPFMWATMAVPLAGPAKGVSVLARMKHGAKVEAAFNGGYEIATQPLVMLNKEKMGLEHTFGDAAVNIVLATLLGGGFGAAFRFSGSALHKVRTGEWTPEQYSRAIVENFPKLSPEEKHAIELQQALVEFIKTNPNDNTAEGVGRHLRETLEADNLIKTAPPQNPVKSAERIEDTPNIEPGEELSSLKDEFIERNSLKAEEEQPAARTLDESLDEGLPHSEFDEAFQQRAAERLAEQFPENRSPDQLFNDGFRFMSDNFELGDAINTGFLRNQGFDRAQIDDFLDRATELGFIRDNNAGKMVLKRKPEKGMLDAIDFINKTTPEPVRAEIVNEIKRRTLANAKAADGDGTATKINSDSVDPVRLQRSTIITGTPKASDLELEILRKVSDAPPIESPAFKRWSGGAPYMPARETFKHDFKTGEGFVAELFHGSPRKIDTLVAKGGKTRDTREPAVFLTNNESIANLYANPTRGIEGLGDNPDASVFRLFAKMNNPLVHEPKGFLKPLEIGQSFFSKEISERLNAAKGNLLKKIDLTPEEQKIFNAVTKTAKDYEKFRDNVEFYGENFRDHLDPNDFEYKALELHEAKFSKNPDLLNELDEIAFNNEFGLSEIFKEAKRRGHDGIVFKNMFDEPGGRQDQFIVFNERQLKSFDNRGTFDPNDPNILKQLGDDGIQGAFDPQDLTIQLSRHAIDPLNTARHEVVHVLNELGLIRPDEWALLSQSAKQFDWIKKHNIEERYKGDFEGDTAAKQKAMTEEAIAEEFALWRQGKTDYTPEVLSIFERIKEILGRIAATLKSQGIETFEDVFKLIDDGEIKARFGQEVPQAKRPELNVEKRYVIGGDDGLPPETVTASELLASVEEAELMSDLIMSCGGRK